MNEDLEKLAIEIDLNGTPARVVEFDGIASYVLGISEPIVVEGKTVGYEKVLSVSIKNENNNNEVRFRFRGDAPIQVGENISAGILLTTKEEEYKKALYICKWAHVGALSHFPELRVDFMWGYNPSIKDYRKIIGRI